MRTIQEIIASRDSILQAQYKEHVATFQPDTIRDITDAFLKSMHKDINGNDVSGDVTTREDQVVMSTWEIFAGGFESTFQTLRWALAYLLHYPEVGLGTRKNFNQRNENFTICKLFYSCCCSSVSNFVIFEKKNVLRITRD